MPIDLILIFDNFTNAFVVSCDLIALKITISSSGFRRDEIASVAFVCGKDGIVLYRFALLVRMVVGDFLAEAKAAGGSHTSHPEILFLDALVFGIFFIL